MSPLATLGLVSALRTLYPGAPCTEGAQPSLSRTTVLGVTFFVGDLRFCMRTRVHERDLSKH